mmetsp:Transcript_36334/g.66783  ORF Transcript_36334/g.66783 Transcript_36334/m.66783 type:complete len:93 (+) Transcript_36334:98-376(+)
MMFIEVMKRTGIPPCLYHITCQISILPQFYPRTMNALPLVLKHVEGSVKVAGVVVNCLVQFVHECIAIDVNNLINTTSTPPPTTSTPPTSAC